LSRLGNWLMGKNIRAIFTVIAAVIAVLSFYLYNLSHQLFAIGYPISLFVFIFGLYLHRKLGRKALLMQFRSQWGKPLNIKRNIGKIKDVYNSLCFPDKDCCHLDDQTWNDLHLDDIYAQADRTQTSCGQVLLYNILRKPIIDYSRWESSLFQDLEDEVGGIDC